MAAVLTPPRTSTRTGRAHLRLVGPDETVVASESPEPLFSPQAVLVAIGLTVVLMVGALAVGRGAFAGLAPDAPAPAAADASAAAAASVGTTVVVRPGDTLWSIARDLQPQGDIRPLVDRLVAAHGSSSIAPGDRISVDG